jgi:predicted acylesterase/phospholipase RssA
MGRRMLVDGGVRSSTNVDVAVAAGARLIIVAAPLASDPDDRPAPVLRAARLHSDRKLRRELRAAEAAGAQVLVLRPGAEEARSQGLTFLRTDEHGEAAELTRARTAAVLRAPAGRGFRRRWATATAARRRARSSDRRDVGT